MKTLVTKKVSQMLLAGVVVALFAVAYIANPNFLKAPKAQATAADNISGWVWSENIGWISFNSTSDASPQGYGVSVNTASESTIPPGKGNFSGNAWGENIGWVSFDRNTTGNPPATAADPDLGASVQGSPLAYVDWSTGKVYGWMRALAGTDAQAGGWDGWIELSNDGNASWAGKGVKISSNNFSGYAWGGDVVGWIDFAPKIGGVSVGPRIGVPPCTVSQVTTWGACQPLVSCSTVDPSGTGGTFNNLSGIKVGVCATGGTVTSSCSTATLVCPAAPTAPAGTCSLTNLGACRFKFKQF